MANNTKTQQPKKAPSKSKNNTETVKQAENSIVGKLVKLTPDTKRLIGGGGIPANARTDELYISRVNPNGTVVVSYSDSLCELGCLFMDNIEFAGGVWEHHDTIEEEPLMDIRIFGVEERIDNIELNKKRLNVPDDKIFMDYERKGCKPTAKRAWVHPADKDYVLVLPDDVDLCDDFIHYCNLVVKNYGESIISLFPIQFLSRNSIYRMPKNPYVATRHLSGAGIIMPAEWVQPCIDSWVDSIEGDDTNIEKWGMANNKRMITTLPALLQHIGDVSVFNPKRAIGRTDFYRKDVSKYDWDNTYLNLWNNIAR